MMICKRLSPSLRRSSQTMEAEEQCEGRLCLCPCFISPWNKGGNSINSLDYHSTLLKNKYITQWLVIMIPWLSCLRKQWCHPPLCRENTFSLQKQRKNCTLKENPALFTGCLFTNILKCYLFFPLFCFCLLCLCMCACAQRRKHNEKFMYLSCQTMVAGKKISEMKFKNTNK